MHEHAANLSKILEFALHDEVYYKVKQPIKVIHRKVGPKHSGTVGFYYDISRHEELVSIINTAHVYLLLG